MRGHVVLSIKQLARNSCKAAENIAVIVSLEPKWHIFSLVMIVIHQTAKLKPSPNIPCIQYCFNPSDNCFDVFTLFILVVGTKYMEQAFCKKSELTPNSSLMQGHCQNHQSSQHQCMDTPVSYYW